MKCCIIAKPRPNHSQKIFCIRNNYCGFFLISHKQSLCNLKSKLEIEIYISSTAFSYQPTRNLCVIATSQTDIQETLPNSSEFLSLLNA